MVYIIPRLFICPKCKTEFNYSPHDGWVLPTVKGQPFCPKCFVEFLKINVPLMEQKEPGEPFNINAELEHSLKDVLSIEDVKKYKKGE